MSWLSTAQLPRPHDKERLAVAWTRWSEKAARPDDAMGVALLEALFGNSPYLAETALQNPTFMTDLWRDGPDAVVTRLVAALAEARNAARDGARPDAVAATLRRLKRQQALAIAVADIAGVWPLEKITGELSAFADGWGAASFRYPGAPCLFQLPATRLQLRCSGPRYRPRCLAR